MKQLVFNLEHWLIFVPSFLFYALINGIDCECTIGYLTILGLLLLIFSPRIKSKYKDFINTFESFLKILFFFQLQNNGWQEADHAQGLIFVLICICSPFSGTQKSVQLNSVKQLIVASALVLGCYFACQFNQYAIFAVCGLMRLLPLKSELERPPTSRGSSLPSLVLGTALGWWTIHNNLSGFHDSANLCLLVLALLVALAAKFKLHGQAFLIGLVLGFGYTQRHQVAWLYLLVALVYLIKFIKQRQADR